MPHYYADLHVHSRHAYACAQNADLEHLAYYGALKGLGVVATGDFTHPVWLAELKEKLVPAEAGLFRLKPEIENAVLEKLPLACRNPVRFILSVEISTIYKKTGRTRKIHHLIYVPDFAAADVLVEKLSKIGNLKSDGRPILGLDSRDLLEIALSTGPHSFLIPAHIWTPWFAVLGSRSGFDTVDEAYGDLANHVFAVETGLSSDPEMNWRVSSLDRFRLTSSSDAHSPQKLGREATMFSGAMDYFALKRALETGEGYVGTVEFFPEEGKYHLDGHRNCGVCLTPEETKANGGLCPACGKPVTVGVQHRVEALADRQPCCGRPHTAGEVCSLVPLHEVLGEIHGMGATSKKVQGTYNRLTHSLGHELAILSEVPPEDIAKAESSLLAEAITRLRKGEVIRKAGYDGEYGVIRLFDEEELGREKRGGVLFTLEKRAQKKEEKKAKPVVQVQAVAPQAPMICGLDAEQQHAVEHGAGPLLVVAGPGSGKTRVLTQRIAQLVKSGEAAESCLAVTFTRRAAGEMRERLAALLPDSGGRVAVHTFHSLALAILREHGAHAGLHRGFAVAGREEGVKWLAQVQGMTEAKAEKMLNAIAKARRTGETCADAEAYRSVLALHNAVDLDELVSLAVQVCEDEPGIAALYRQKWKWVSIDEYQDLDAMQYRLVRCIVPPDGNVCAIGDPNQAIYSFRGADVGFFRRFTEDFPNARVIRLTRNYRSRPAIVAASSQVVEADADAMLAESAARIALHVAPDAMAEAEFITRTIEQLMGGNSSFALYSGKADGAEASLSFSDFAVLYRTEAQADALVAAFERSGMPYRCLSHQKIVPAADGGLPVTEAETWDPRAQAVSLLTFHAAKGLEFPVVFMAGLEEGLMPLFFGEADPQAVEEEQRLFYVGMTRAKERLYLTRAKKRLWRGSMRELAPSRFLSAIEQTLLSLSETKRKKQAAKQMELLI